MAIDLDCFERPRRISTQVSGSSSSINDNIMRALANVLTSQPKEQKKYSAPKVKLVQDGTEFGGVYANEINVDWYIRKCIGEAIFRIHGVKSYLQSQLDYAYHADKPGYTEVLFMGSVVMAH